MWDNKTLAIAIVLIGGGLAAFQAPTNGLLAQAVRSPVNAAFVSFAVATAVLLGAALLIRTSPDVEAVRAMPWYGWIGGVYGAVFVTASAFAVSRIGVASTVTAFLVGQMVMALVLDHIGAFGVPPRPLDVGRLAGLGLLVTGAILVRRS